MTRFTDRQFMQEIKSAGLTLVEFGFTGSGHLKARVRSGEGPVLTVVAPCTGSDWRGQRNRQAPLRDRAGDGLNNTGIPIMKAAIVSVQVRTLLGNLQTPEVAWLLETHGVLKAWLTNAYCESLGENEPAGVVVLVAPETDAGACRRVLEALGRELARLVHRPVGVLLTFHEQYLPLQAMELRFAPVLPCTTGV
jgi:hypothetical protein